MGYSAYGAGDIVLKKGTDEEKVNRFLKTFKEERLLKDIDVELFHDETGNPNIHVSEGDSHWSNDSIFTLFTLAKEFTEEGCVDYFDEYGNDWRYRFNPETEEWDELAGHVIYDLAEVPEEELINALQKYGYTVTKGSEQGPNNEEYPKISTCISVRMETLSASVFRWWSAYNRHGGNAALLAIKPWTPISNYAITGPAVKAEFIENNVVFSVHFEWYDNGYDGIIDVVTEKGNNWFENDAHGITTDDEMNIRLAQPVSE